MIHAQTNQSLYSGLVQLIIWPMGNFKGGQSTSSFQLPVQLLEWRRIRYQSPPPPNPWPSSGGAAPYLGTLVQARAKRVSQSQPLGMGLSTKLYPVVRLSGMKVSGSNHHMWAKRLVSHLEPQFLATCTKLEHTEPDIWKHEQGSSMVKLCSVSTAFIKSTALRIMPVFSSIKL